MLKWVFEFGNGWLKWFSCWFCCIALWNTPVVNFACASWTVWRRWSLKSVRNPLSDEIFFCFCFFLTWLALFCQRTVQLIIWLSGINVLTLIFPFGPLLLPTKPSFGGNCVAGAVNLNWFHIYSSQVYQLQTGHLEAAIYYLFMLSKISSNCKWSKSSSRNYCWANRHVFVEFQKTRDRRDTRFVADNMLLGNCMIPSSILVCGPLIQL